MLQRLGDRYADALATHHEVMRSAIAAHAGTEVSTEGDSFFVIFDTPGAALQTAVEAQRNLAAVSWPGDDPVAVRMGLHFGAVTLSGSEYVGVELHRAARISSVAHGGQIVISDALRQALGSALPAGASLRSLGDHRLKDFDEAVGLFQVDVEGLRAEFPPLTSLSARFDLVPSELTAFVGRDAELEAVRSLLAETRLLTLTGPGGTGKTRLALEAARTDSDAWPHGLAFVPLATVSDAALVAPTIRGAMGFAEEPGRRSVETLIEKLRRHRLLLILDNFEQVIGAADFVAELLAGTEQLTVLVTSRTGLHLQGEQEFPVPPMAVPIIGSVVDLEAIATNDSVRLFVDRARRAQPRFTLDAHNAAAVAQICQRLEGLPLAIELAAARIKLLAPEALLGRLSRRLDVLDGRGASDRRRTLRGTIDWSHDLLGPDEQVLLRRLAIFSGGVSLEVMEDLAQHLDLPSAPDVADVLDATAVLIDHSLLRQVETSDEPRYVMLETIREYGLERLEAAGEQEAMSRAHARWFLDHVHQLAPKFTTGPEAPDHVESDHSNVRAALRSTIEREDTERALIAVSDLWRFWHLRGHLREGLAVCEQVAAMPGADEPSAAAAGAHYAHASLLYWQGRTDEALAGYRTTLEIARAVGSRPHEADAQFALAFALGISKDWTGAHAASKASETIYEELGDAFGATNARFTDAYVASLSGQWRQAAEQLRDVQLEIEAHGDRFWWLNSRIVLAWTLTRLERFEESREILRGNLEGSIELGDRSAENMTVQALATIAAFDGDEERALRLAGVAESIAEDFGGKAPTELVIGLDPVTLVRERGMMDPDDAARLVLEGRALSTDVARDMAREVANRG